MLFIKRLHHWYIMLLDYEPQLASSFKPLVSNIYKQWKYCKLKPNYWCSNIEQPVGCKYSTEQHFPQLEILYAKFQWIWHYLLLQRNQFFWISYCFQCNKLTYYLLLQHNVCLQKCQNDWIHGCRSLGCCFYALSCLMTHSKIFKLFPNFWFSK